MKKTLALLFLLLLSVSAYAKAPLLTKEEAQKVELYLNNICPDTFCAGDIDYVMSDLSCTKKSCTITMTMSSYYDEFEPYSHVCTITGIKTKRLSLRAKEDMFYDYVRDNCLDF